MFEAPTQYGLPSRQVRRTRASGLPRVGPSASGAAGRHLLQRPERARVLNSTVPRPSQWSPTRSNRPGATAAAVVLVAPIGASCIRMVAYPDAQAAAGRPKNRTAARRSILIDRA